MREPTPRGARRVRHLLALLTRAGIPVAPGFVNGGHNWFAWRLDLKDFLTRTAFFPQVAG
nr:hypothetical protein OG999_15425 [Streptomyces sp. NBC_00886]